MINVYNKYLNMYVEKKGNLACYPYLLVFVNFISSSNSRVEELHDLHEQWKHQIGRHYSKQYRLECRRECKMFIDFIMEHYDEEEQEPKKKNIKIHSTIRGVMK